ncbi:MAG TPA: EAL domain-containing protein [Candidatus Baltobacteraceae bacterium]|nr:EAL domain-containing protein [Candidatus Baltobacteraceae bacterium]
MGDRLRVLCIDDSPDDADLNVMALQRHGYVIEHERADTPEQAQKLLVERQWDLILCDYSMPQFSAPAMLDLLAELRVDVPCLIVSGAIGEEAAVETIRRGAYDYIFKNNLKRLGPAADRALRDSEIRRARQAMEVQLREREMRLRLLFEQLPALVITCDSTLTITSVEGAQLGQLGMNPDAMISTRIASSPLIADESRFPARRAHLRALQGVPSEYEYIWGGKTLHCHVEPLRDLDGRIVGTIAVSFDITERKVAEQRLAYFAQYDPLTDLPNRAVLEDRLSQAIELTNRREGNIAVISVDIDRFKDVNDSYGTANGDEILRAVGARLVRIADKGATVSRVGEDQFVILLVEVGGRSALESLVQRVHDAFDAPYLAADLEVYLTASIGASLHPDDATDGPSLIAAAEAAMFSAKQSGRNTWRFFAPGMLVSSAERITLKRDLRSAMDRNQLLLYYQPIFRASDMAFTGFEALVRWQHPTLGLLMPDHFIPLAEESGSIDAVGEWVFAAVCADLAKWDEAGVSVPRVCVNISARQFERAGLIAAITGTLKNTNVDPQRLELELTESSIMRDITGGIALLNELKSLGLRLSVDDFGTGYTSLSFLRRFPIDTLKIDKAFIRDLLPGSHDEAIVKAIVTLAQNLGLISIAEGIETQITLDQVRALGVDEVQGYYLTRPIPSEDCAAFCADRMTVSF